MPLDFSFLCKFSFVALQTFFFLLAVLSFASGSTSSVRTIGSGGLRCQKAAAVACDTISGGTWIFCFGILNNLKGSASSSGWVFLIVSETFSRKLFEVVSGEFLLVSEIVFSGIFSGEFLEVFWAEFLLEFWGEFLVVSEEIV